MRPCTPLLSLLTGVAVVIVACGAGRASPPVLRSRAAATDSALPASPPDRDARVDWDPATYSACAAPSVVKLRSFDDARDPGAVVSCTSGDPWARLVDREQAATVRCDLAGRPIDVKRILDGALPLDAVTTEHVRSVFRTGQAHGRRPDAFGLVGDSMTVDGNFLRPFASGGTHRVVPADVERALAFASPHGGAATALDLFRGVRAGSVEPPLATDSFVAPRAAKVGARATWPLSPRGPGQASPLDEMVAAVSPAYAVVLYGANDALWRTDSVDLLTRGFDAALAGIVDALEARGIVAILTTVPKHMRERGWTDCPASGSGGGNERFAVQATILSAAVADLACRRHLPLIDLRWALDPLLDHGVGPDGVHLSVHPGGGGVLDASGLECGYNVRNLVTLRELARVVDAVSW